MSIFGSIINKIFGSAPATPASASQPEPGAANAANAPVSPAGSVPAGQTPAAATPAAHVDIAKVLDDLNDANPETLDWRVSIVDLLKLLGLDSSLAARKQLAAELKYDGDTEDTAVMNVWLHKKVIDLVAANGGEVPSELLKR
ncbi:protein of unknown function [Rhodoblastus acidophilus]|uniref:DUF3597 domain-containing protein n=1 Tax=Rhodoblastus acidophilus TaxID=1074 RepID=A0A212RM80_RHOAC|nr:DUF3597 domain-containing protein [Rhodoblastus acidophilus]PPQ39153.1 DUF3597 domain-containing protein [Rhodoblastus acidophilus]RAI21041.1 DUF3597 domain-containing protein [Rhodoblastus acidophilus]SNB73628.1 protein of unknown function [Rhodoblastus acidophilus]